MYTLPRYSVLSGHEYKACQSDSFHISGALTDQKISVIPYDKVFAASPTPDQHEFIHGNILNFKPNSVTVTRSTGATEVIPFNYAVYALGAHLPAPINLWGDATAAHAPPNTGSNSEVVEPNHSGTKAEGIAWLKRHQTVVEKADSVLVVGGGALGIRAYAPFASSVQT